ncbi:MAG: helix-hairpin-helix domain-containing protein [Chthoniobacterales bacterium]|nr:helix-hairpin-helix domain-containing protein [Chthoniobacterales bacterium]
MPALGAPNGTAGEAAAKEWFEVVGVVLARHAAGHRAAVAIIDRRPYGKVEDLQRVPGIGPKRFEAIAPMVKE